MTHHSPSKSAPHLQAREAYNALPPEQQVMLQLLSVVYITTNLSTIKRLLAQLKPPFKGAELAERPTPKLAKTWKSLGLVKLSAANIMSEEMVDEYIVLHAIKQGHYQTLQAACNKTPPIAAQP